MGTRCIPRHHSSQLYNSMFRINSTVTLLKLSSFFCNLSSIDTTYFGKKRVWIMHLFMLDCTVPNTFKTSCWSSMSNSSSIENFFVLFHIICSFVCSSFSFFLVYSSSTFFCFIKSLGYDPRLRLLQYLCSSLIFQYRLSLNSLKYFDSSWVLVTVSLYVYD